MSNSVIYILAAGAAVLFILWKHGFLDLLMDMLTPSEKTSSTKTAVGESQKLFRAATKAAISEAQDAAADKIAQTVHDQVLASFTSPFVVGTPSAPSAPTAS